MTISSILKKSIREKLTKSFGGKFHELIIGGSDSKVLCQKIPQGEDVRLAEKILCKALPDWKAEKEAI